MLVLMLSGIQQNFVDPRFSQTLVLVKSRVQNMTKLKGMTVDHDFGLPFSLFPPKEGGRKGAWIGNNRNQKSCLSARSQNIDLDYTQVTIHNRTSIMQTYTNPNRV